MIIAKKVHQPPWILFTCSRAMVTFDLYYLIPVINVYITLISLHELLKNGYHTLDIGFQSSINIELNQFFSLWNQFFPVIESSPKVHILDPTKRNAATIIKIFFIGIHNDCSRKNLLHSSGCAEIALKFSSYSFCRIFLYFFHHQSKKFIPLCFG